MDEGVWITKIYRHRTGCDVMPIKLIHFAHAILIVTIENFVLSLRKRGKDFVRLELRVQVLLQQYSLIKVWRVKFLTGID